MLINESNQIPVQILNGLKAKYFFQSYRTAPIRLEIDMMPTGSWFLNLYISRIGDQIYRLLVEISESRLKLISRAEMPIHYAFLNPENDILYAALFDANEELTRLSCISPLLLENNNPIPENQFISFDLDLAPTTFDLIEHARNRGRIIIEIKSESRILKSNLNYGYIRNLLIPFSELIKTAVLDHNPRLSQKKIEDYLNFGFSYIGIGSLHALIELNHTLNLFGFNTELDNLSGLFTLLNADDPDEILKAIQYFKNKKIIPEYIRLLHSISKSGTGFALKMATPSKICGEVYFDWARAQIIRNIIESSLPETDYDEIVTGILTCLDFENRKRPVFSLNSVENNQIYSGFIDPSLDSFINEKGFQFCKKIYECTLRVLFIPESLKKARQYRYTLLRIEELSED